MAVKFHPLFPNGEFNLCLDDNEIEAIRKHVNDPQFHDLYYYDEQDTEAIAIERYIEHQVRGEMRAQRLI
jgi:hypothetical protein